VERFVDVTGVEVIADYRLRLTFADDTLGDVDFTGRQWRGLFEPLRDPAYFARVKVDPQAGTITRPTASTWRPRAALQRGPPPTQSESPEPPLNGSCGATGFGRSTLGQASRIVPGGVTQGSSPEGPARLLELARRGGVIAA
jgi:Protein of unknown function (DUF2442)